MLSPHGAALAQGPPSDASTLFLDVHCEDWGQSEQRASCEESLRAEQAAQGLREKAGWGACGWGRSGGEVSWEPVGVSGL